MKKKNPVVNLVENQEWLEPLGKKSDALVNSALPSTGEAGGAAKDALINNRLLGHKRHPTITDVPFGSWTATLIADVLEANGKERFAAAADTTLGVGLIASLIAAAGGLADLSETKNPADRKLGMMHGIFQGIATLLYGGSFVARRCHHRGTGRVLSFTGYGNLIAASYLAAELAHRRQAAEAD